MEETTNNKKRIAIICGICILAIAVLTAVVFLLWPESSDTGAQQARTLYELGVLKDYDGVYLAKTPTPKQVEDDVRRLLGTGDGERATNFYRYLQIEQAPDLSISMERETVTETEAYGLLLRALGYTTAPSDVLNKAKEVGFGILREVRDSGQALTNGNFALILYESLLVRPPNQQNYPTYRILGYLTSDCKETLLENGLYDAIPEEYRWDSLLNKSGLELKKHYKQLWKHV